MLFSIVDHFITSSYKTCMYNQWIKYLLSLPAAIIEKAEAQLEKALEMKVTLKRKKSVILGFAGSGKTHTLALLLCNELPSKRVSTQCFKLPVRSIGLRRFQMSPSSKSCAEISQSEFSRRIMRSGKDSLPKISRSSTESKVVIEQVELTLNEGKDLPQNNLASKVKADLLRDYFYAYKVKPLSDEVVAEINDSGGQPQFLEILPRFVSGLSIAIVVTNLSERLDKCPTSYYYGKDGVLVGEGEPSKITNEQMLRQFLQMVVSQSQGNSQIKFIIVGTHRDMEHVCSESREEKERKLSNMVKSFDLGDNVVYADPKCKKLIFAVNAKDPNETDYEMGRKVMEVVMDKDGAEIINIPLKFHLLEKTLREMSTTGQIAFTLSEVMQNVREYFNNEMSLREGLHYLEQSNRIFYFRELFPDKVIGDPQLLLNMVTRIVVEHIKLNSGIDTGRTMYAGWKKFKEQGILTVEILKKISNCYDSHFTPEDMLKLLEELLICFRMNPGEFLMPCLLSTQTCSPRIESPTANPMLQFSMMLHFPRGIARIGIYCSTICKLITGEGWKHCEYSKVSRNLFCLTHHDVFGGVTCVQDYYDSFFQVTFHFPSDAKLYPKILPDTCVALRDTVKKVIKEVTRALCYRPDEPELAFECEEHRTASHSLHPARYIKDCPSLLCTKDSWISTALTEQHKLWLGECVSAVVVTNEDKVDNS